MLALLSDMVAINSFTENAVGVNHLGEFTAGAFAPLGFTATYHASANPAYGRHLILRKEGKPGSRTIALVSHLDTVFAESEEMRNNFRWRREGDRIYGPGTNDIKGGTALIFLMLSVLAEEEPELYQEMTWSILLNASEETISAEFRELCREQLPKETLACLVFEGDGGQVGAPSLVVARKGRATFLIEVEGRGAHAGSSHRTGLNAIVELAGIVQKVSELTDYAEELTVNVGSISGGTVPNRVPHFARAELEMRAFSHATYLRAKTAILAFAGEGRIRSAEDEPAACQVRVAIGEETVGWPRNAATDDLFILWEQAGHALGIPVRSEKRGGLSDGNVLWDLFPTLDGLGPCGENAHCSEQSADGSKEQEWVDASSFVPKAVLNLWAIIALCRQAGEVR